MKRDTRVQAIACAILALCLTLSGVLAINLTSYAGRMRLTYTDRAEEGQPPEVSLGIAMGAFRGIFVNFLWIRANAMKEAGKFYEASQLASTITRLQPRFPRVWVFHAWNLAYNISVTTQTPQERWAWVNAGIELLRDQGIPANPNDMLLHKELGWIFLHKIGGYTDDANVFYKRRLAREWTIVLGPPPAHSADDRDRTKAIQKYVDWLTLLDQAPLTLADCIKAEPSVKTLVDQINTLGKIRADESVDTMFDVAGRYELIRATTVSPLRAFYEQNLMGERTRGIIPLVSDPQYAKAWPALLSYMRRRLVTEKYHMEISRMIRYTQMLGPMDWRHYGSHAVYWGQKGVEVGMTRYEDRIKRDFDFINTDRIVAQAVQELFRTGEVYFDFLSADQKTGFYQGVPSPHFVQSYGDVLEGMISRSWADNPALRGYRPLSAGYENFIRDAVTFFYRRGQVDVAEHWMQVLRTSPLLNTNDPDRIAALNDPVAIFVAKELQDRVTSPSILVNQVSASLMGAYASGLLGRDPELFREQFAFAKQVHGYYMTQQLRNTPAGGEQSRMGQMDPDFRRVSGNLFYTFITQLSFEDAQVVYTNAPNDLQLYAYTFILQNAKPAYESMPHADGRTFAQVFPAPEGYEEFVAKERQRYIDGMNSRQAPIESK